MRRIIFVALITALLFSNLVQAQKGDWFFSTRGNYQFQLPGKDWTIIKDGWKHQWELGYRRVFIGETYKYGETQEVDQPARLEQRDVFEVEAGFVYPSYNLKIIIATARIGDLFRYLEEFGVRPDPKDRQAIARAYLELFSSPVAGSALAGRLLDNRLIVAYYRPWGEEISPSVLEKSLQDFRALAASISSQP